jgi:outer membrane receptor protein involved in Fe transport
MNVHLQTRRIRPSAIASFVVLSAFVSLASASFGAASQPSGPLAPASAKTAGAAASRDADAKTIPLETVDAPASLKSAAAEDAVALTPFEVKSDRDGSYGAVNSNSITMFETDLAKVPVSADVYTKTFMDDVGARSIESLVLGNTAGAGTDSASVSAIGNSQAGDRNTAAFQLRGLTSSVSLRNSFMPGGGLGVGISSMLDVERVEIINGPQSLLYGLGGAGGVINTITKRAVFDKPVHGTVYGSLDGFGNPGAQIDVGQGGKHLAYVASLVKERMGGYRKNIYTDSTGAYAQAAWRYGRTTVRLTGEYTDANRYFSWTGTSGGLVYRGPTTDVRNGQLVSYLLASNQLAQAANGGASTGGVIGNGHLTWKTINAYEGNARFEKTINQLISLEVQTRLAAWASMSLSLGYRLTPDDFRGNGLTFSLDAPGYQFNNLGKWAIMEESSALDPNSFSQVRNKSARLAFNLENSLFGGRLKSSSVIGAEFNRAETHSQYYVLLPGGRVRQCADEFQERRDRR